MNGKIIKKTDRGFGFIEAEDGKEIFFHSTSLVGTSFEEIQEGAVVSFDVEQTQKGLNAQNVTPAGQQTAAVIEDVVTEEEVSADSETEEEVVA